MTIEKVTRPLEAAARGRGDSVSSCLVERRTGLDLAVIAQRDVIAMASTTRTVFGRMTGPGVYARTR